LFCAQFLFQSVDANPIRRSTLFSLSVDGEFGQGGEEDAEFAALGLGEEYRDVGVCC
jgi:hypothetical protein